jgi:hypothetical protein
MKKALAAAAFAVLLVPAGAGAVLQGTYDGSYGGTGDLDFELHKNQGNRSVRVILYEDLPLSCEDGPNAGSGQYPASKVRVEKDRTFRSVVREGGNFRFSGKFNKAYTKASGVIRLAYASLPPSGDCDSGRTEWSASLLPVR